MDTVFILPSIKHNPEYVAGVQYIHVKLSGWKSNNEPRETLHQETFTSRKHYRFIYRGHLERHGHTFV